MRPFDRRDETRDTHPIAILSAAKKRFDPIVKDADVFASATKSACRPAAAPRLPHTASLVC